MDFGLSDIQEELRGLARKILDDTVSPASLAAYDEYRAPRFDQALWQTLLEAGLPAAAVAEDYGGMGLGFMELGLFIEELGRSVAPVPVLAHCVSGMLPLQRFAPAALRERILPAAARGELLLSGDFWTGLSSADPTRVQAREQGGALLLEGECAMVPFARQADWLLLPVRLGTATAVVLVNPKAPGVTLTDLQMTHFEPHCQVSLAAVSVPAADVVMASGGEVLLAWTRERCAAALCAQQLGAVDHALRMAAGYTSQRQQFGVPIATFQAVGHRMADCYIDVECLRLCTWQALSLLSDEQPATTEVQIAKIWAGDVGHRVSYASQHVHGGTGIDRDYPLWRYCLWLRYNEMALGSTGAQVAALGQRLAAGEGLFT
jgi:3-oxocholest-4-en-26-oyl-CoA dehydrogenase beta subunit